MTNIFGRPAPHAFAEVVAEIARLVEDSDRCRAIAENLINDGRVALQFTFTD